ncbi:MAG TPA: MMPL family transporter [Rectinemataceae bacterium]|nr:MMPL family transporter [Rectinemataceae bacterium]
MIERFLAWSSKAYRRPRLIVAAVFVLVGLFALGIPRLKFDNSIRSMLPATNRDRVVSDYYEDPARFGSSDLILVGIDTPDAYSAKTLSYVIGLESAIDALDDSLPAQDMARLLGIGEKEGATVVEALKGVGIYENNYAQTLLPLISSKDQLVQAFSWDAPFAAKVAAAAAAVHPKKKLFDYFQAPIYKTQSLASADYLSYDKENQELVVEKLLKDGDPANGGDALRGRVAGWSLYDKALVSSDGKLTTIVITPNVSDEAVLGRLSTAIARILKDKADPEFRTYLDGEPVIENQISLQMFRDLGLLVPVVVVVVLLILFLNFRNLQGVAYPAAIVLVAVAIAMGSMAFCRVPISIVGITIPVLLVAIVSAYGIHQMNHYFLSPETDKRSILDGNMRSVGLAIALSGIAVMVGFGALASESFVPIKNFGIFTALGDLVGVLCALYLLPSLILVSRRPKKVFQEEHRRGWIGALLGFFDRLNLRHSGAVLVAAVAVSLLSVWGILNLRTEINNVSFFKASTPIHAADDHLDAMLAGTEVFNVILDTDLSDPATRTGKRAGTPVEATTPAVLDGIEAFSRDVRQRFPFVTKVLSFDDVIKKINQEMNGGSSRYYAIPSSRNLIDQYLLVFTGDVSNLLTADHDKLRVSLTLKRVPSDRIEEVKRYCLAYFPKDFLERNHLQVRVSGSADLYDVANTLLVDGMLKSIVLCAAIVLLLLVLVLRDLRMSLIAMVPIFVTILLNFGLMGVLGIPLNIATALVSSVAIGIGVDYSIHFITWYRNELRAAPDIGLALTNTIDRKGRAILYNMFVILGGFLVLGLSNFVPLIQFGLLVAACMLFSAVGALAVVPAIIRTLAKRDYGFLYLGTRSREETAMKVGG